MSILYFSTAKILQSDYIQRARLPAKNDLNQANMHNAYSNNAPKNYNEEPFSNRLHEQKLKYSFLKNPLNDQYLKVNAGEYVICQLRPLSCQN